MEPLGHGAWLMTIVAYFLMLTGAALLGRDTKRMSYDHLTYKHFGMWNHLAFRPEILEAVKH